MKPMTYDSQKYHRRSLRLKGYDYSQAGPYFITVCVEDRACLFGDVVDDRMHLNDAGWVVLAEWNALAVRFPSVELDVFGVMPNHIHGIIVMETDGAVAKREATSSVDMGPGRFEQTPVGATLVVALAPPAPVVGECESTTMARPRATTRVAPTPTAETGRTTVASEPAPLPTVGDVVGAFKSLTTVSYIYSVKHSGWPPFRGRLWQRNYHEHIIRNEESLNLVRQYILDNPARWESDEENPQVGRPIKKKA
jgi:REP element-mobilizing transposase RayT